jgi:HK97 gp10 family phage protein
MGLRGTVSVGLPTTTSIYHRDIDYSDAVREAIDEFMDAATSDVPVDTGTLQASISCEAEYMGFTAYADTNYAEYVEYGTYKMDAQPYFEDNLESVAEELHANCVEIWQDAEQQDKEQYQA